MKELKTLKSRRLKRLSSLLILLLLCATVPIHSAAQTVTIDDLKYTLNSTTGEAECSGLADGFTSFTNGLTIPGSVSYDGKQYSVTSIGERAFYRKSAFRGTLKLPNSIKVISDYAFYNCLFTGSLIIPSGVESIGHAAFSCCNGFGGSLAIPNTVETIGIAAFYNCYNLTGSITIPNSVTCIEDSVFCECSKLNGSLKIGNSVKSIGRYAFSNCHKLKGSLVIPDSVKTIGTYAFRGCFGFTGSLTIPNTVSYMGPHAFSECTGLNGSLTIGESVTEIDSGVFSGCHELTSLILPKSLKRIQMDAFRTIGFKTINCATIKPPTLSSAGVFTSYSASLYVPFSSIDSYKKANEWKSFKDIRVLDAPTDIAIEPSSLSIYVRESSELSLTIQPDDAEKQVIWTSSDESIASVDNGVIAGKKSGKVIITATSVVNSISATCEVTILPVEITFDATENIIAKGYAQRLTPIINPEKLAGKTISWASSNNNVATVDDVGNITGVEAGVATITATYAENISAATTVNIAAIYMEDQMALSVGESEKLNATIQPAGLADRELIWSTSDDQCVTVDKWGNVTVVGFGSAEIAAALADNPDVKATCTVHASGGAEIGYYYDASLEGVVITSIPNEISYIIPSKVSYHAVDYAVKSVNLETQPSNLKKVAYPEGITNNFDSDIATVAYDPSACEIKDGVITEPVTGELVYVDPSISGEFEISADINIVGPNAFACCSEITGLKIVGSSLPLAFHNVSGSAPAFADCPLTELYLGRNVSYNGSPFRDNKTLCELTFGAPVSEIGEDMFNGCDGIHEVAIPSTIEIVGKGAFGNCKGLSQFIIEDSRNTIEIDDAFDGSTMDYLYYGRQAYRTSFWPHTLKSIEIGRYVDTLRDSEFTDMAKLYSLTIGVGVRVINKNAFRSSKITKVLWLPNTPPTGYENIVADIYYVSTDNYEFDEEDMKISPNLSSKFMVDGLVYVFNKQASDRTCAVIDSRYNRYITALDVPHKVTYQNIEFTVEEINDYALYCNKYFESASIGDGIISIGRYSLFNCDEISSAPYVGKSVETIGDYAFNSCFKMPSIVIPDATKYLGAWSLANCSALESCLLGSGMETIQTGCFANDVSLKQLIVPANVTTIANQVFDYCTSFAYLEISDRTKTLTMGYSEHNPKYEPSQGVIGGLANAGVPLFDYCPLKEVYIGGDITYSISPADGYSPFYRNDYLEKVVIHNNETDISNNEFYGCRNLKEVVVGNDVISVGDYAFSGCLSLEYFTLGSRVETIGTDAFSDCDVMKELKSYNPVPPTCGDQAMDDINKFACTLYVAKNAIESYQNADQWKNFFHIEGMEIEAVPVESIDLDPEYWTGVIGSIFRIQATVNPITADNKHIIWASEDENVATVTEGGIVTANGVGSTVITATCGDVVAVCQVVVKPIEGEYIVIDKQKAEVVEGETLQLTATIEPENATDQTITWSSSDTEIATVDENGIVTAVKPGAATITAESANGLKAECIVTVVAKVIEANGITLDVTEADIIEGETLQLTATIEPENATDQTIIWTSSDDAIAIVDANGAVTALSPGEATITASTSNGLSAECKVTVVAKEISVNGLTLNISEAEVLEGETLKLIATIEPEDATDQTIIWSSSDDDVVTVDADGLVTAVNPGEATITATASNGLNAECKIIVTKRTSGINTIVVEGNSIIAPEGSEVYNMQGLRVNPEGLCSGFYIVKISGMKAVKIRVD